MMPIAEIHCDTSTAVKNRQHMVMHNFGALKSWLLRNLLETPTPGALSKYCGINGRPTALYFGYHVMFLHPNLRFEVAEVFLTR